ncbi:DUF4390 domain-containing protein [Thiohalomonas denitrificans]|uniref:DUF4390 domain-containing protein n=1 Tax=Thiohalomonas denitrificans TaxID=415747 RepID=UPI0026F1B751|nr:DUF4390 domain-containing protein [Thiohalomonas denitrificans]
MMLKHWLSALLVSLLPLSVAVAKEDFAVQDAKTRLEGGVYLLDAEVDYRFSSKALDALENGVPLVLVLDIEVEKKRPWWWYDSEVASLEQRFEVQYHALSDQYLLSNLNSGALYAYPTLSSTADAVGDIRSLPLLDANLIEPDATYEVQLRSRLDIEALPLPLRPLAYVLPGWRLSSEWYACALTP